MATFVVVHGAWGGGWGFGKVRRLLAAKGHGVFTPTLTGLGERAHLASPDVDLQTHIADILGVLHAEDLSDVVLVGHSYGGMVVTGVADRARERLARLVYLDAFVPKDGQSLFDLTGEADRARRIEAANAEGEGWKIPPMPTPPDVPPDAARWAGERRASQPLKTFDQPIRLTGALARADFAGLPHTYIFCTRKGPGDPFQKFAEAAKRGEGWDYREIDSGHTPNTSAPEVLAEMLSAIAAE